jgi:protocatechuate 3,4-dioxygenase beta subunit
MRSALLVAIAIALSLPASPRSVQAQQHVAPPDAPSSASLSPAGEPGVRLVVHGTVRDESGRPIPNASIYVYQTDSAGEYVKGLRGGGSDRPRLFAYLRSDDAGNYRFTTIRPGSYPGTSNPGHIHFEIATSAGDTRIYEIVFANDPLIPEGFRAQARQPFGGVAIVEARPVANGTLDIAHDIRVPGRR